MANMSNFLEWQFSSHLTGSGTFTKPAVLAIALTSNTPVDADTGTLSAGNELADAGAYARQTLNPSATNWTDPPAADGIVYNLATITFPQATANQGWVSGYALCSSATHNAGQVYVHGVLTTPKLIEEGDQLVIPISGIALTFA